MSTEKPHFSLHIRAGSGIRFFDVRFQNQSRNGGQIFILVFLEHYVDDLFDSFIAKDHFLMFPFISYFHYENMPIQNILKILPQKN